MKYLSLVVMFVSAGTASAQSAPTYWQDVRPVFRKNCTVCHQAKNLKEFDLSGGLALDTYEAVIKGTKKAVIHVGKSADSPLFKALVTADKARRMPLDASPLSKENIDLIKRWIDAGAREGTKQETVAESTTRKPAQTRKLDVVLNTSAVPPAGSLGKGKVGKLDLALKIGPLSPVAAVAFDPDSKILATGSYGQVALWDLAAGRPIKVLTNVLGAVHDLRFSPDGKLLAVGGGAPAGKGEIRLFDVADGKLVTMLRGHDDVVFGLAFRPDGKKIASASFDHTVRIWDVASHKQERSFTGHSDFVYGVAFSPDGKQLASASKDRSVRLVDADTGKSLFTFSGMEQDILCVAFAPDGKQIVSSGFESSLYVWNPLTGERIRAGAGHGGATHEVGYSKDGKKIVSAGADRLARVWDAASGSLLKSFNVGSSAYSVALSPNGKLLATGSFDGLVRLWDEPSVRQLATLVTLPGEQDQPDWLLLTPEGFGNGSDKMMKLAQWRMAGDNVPGERVWQAIRQPVEIGKALKGEKLGDLKFAK